DPGALQNALRRRDALRAAGVQARRARRLVSPRISSAVVAACRVVRPGLECELGFVVRLERLWRNRPYGGRVRLLPASTSSASTPAAASSGDASASEASARLSSDLASGAGTGSAEADSGDARRPHDTPDAWPPGTTAARRRAQALDRRRQM